MVVIENRWKQRFQNFQKSYILLKQFSSSAHPEIMERTARIQAFEMCFELSWKVLKDYFLENGKPLYSPREILKEAIKDNIICNEHEWIKALQNRNNTVHCYDEAMAEDISNNIYHEYLDIFQEFILFFEKKL